jgi:hypothetical protein
MNWLIHWFERIFAPQLYEGQKSPAARARGWLEFLLVPPVWTIICLLIWWLVGGPLGGKLAAGLLSGAILYWYAIALVERRRRK